jgi:outer membrane receptor for ferrienterochelin and colicin
MKKTLSTFACAMLSTFALGDDVTLSPLVIQTTSTPLIQPIGTVKDVVEKTEVITRQAIAQTQSSTLAEAIDHQAGISVTTGCSICGLKRVQMNGLQGEHTTVLVDGIPFNSTVSSFYGMDAIGTSDIESIEITRGSGASLIAPEAIGGTITIIPRKPHKNGIEVDTSMGTLGTKNVSFIGEAMSRDKKTGILLSVSSHLQGQVDHDHNGISESPKMENQALSMMVTHQFSPYDALELKASHFTSDVLGGIMISESSAWAAYNPAVDDTSFINGNINHRYVGQPMQMLERINTTRDETYLKEHHNLNDTMNLHTTLAFAQQKQDSLYEGADYKNIDKTYFGDVKIDHALNDHHFLTYGMDAKKETSRSQSHFYYDLNGRDKDDFDYTALGLYGQDAWMMDDKNEVTFALRGANITTNWRAQTAQKNEIDKTLVVPRLLYRHNHTLDLTSRLSAGIGYRSPLTFFESEHGLLDNGFAVSITDLEQSHGANYSLSYTKNGVTVTGATAYTKVKNLAYIDGSTLIPTLRNALDPVTVTNADMTIGYALNESLSVAGSYETYHYDHVYQSHLALASIEQRARLSVDYDLKGWEFYTQATWVGARDLTPYGYADRYNDLALTSSKMTKAPAYTTIDMKLSKTITKNFTVYAGAKNLFNYVQSESPLFYDANGNFGSAHIWGPLRGRTVYAGVKMVF